MARVQPAGPRRGVRRTLAAPRAAEVPLHHGDEPRRVLHDPRVGPPRPALVRGRRARGRPPPAGRGARADPDDGPGDGGAPDRVPRGRPPSEARRERDRRADVGRPHGGAAHGRDRVLPAERPAGPDASRRGPGPPVPVPLEPLDELRRRGEEPRDRRREVRAREGPAGPPAAPAAARDPRGKEEGPAGQGRVPLPRVPAAGEPRRPLPGPRDRLLAPLPRHARRRHRDPGGRGVGPPRDDRAGSPPPPLRSRRAPRGGPEDAEARPQAPRQAARDHGERDLRGGRAARAGRPDVAREARPPGSQGRPVLARGARDPHAARHVDLRGDPRGRHPPAPPVRLVLAGRRDDRAGVGGLEDRRDQDDALPDEPRLGAHPGPRPRGRERQAGGRPRGAQGALRRGEQHHVGQVARAGGRPRRVRRRRPQDARQDRPRRAAREGRDPAVRPPRDRQLQLLDGTHVHGHRPHDVPARVRRGRDALLQRAYGVRRARRRTRAS